MVASPYSFLRQGYGQEGLTPFTLFLSLVPGIAAEPPKAFTASRLWKPFSVHDL